MPIVNPIKENNMNQILLEKKQNQIVKVKDLKPEYVRLIDPIFSIFKKILNFLDSLALKGFTKENNPFYYTGAIANFLFGIAVITGIILLFWYKPSVYQAYSSLENLKENNFFSFIGQMIRSLHRYSSDGAMLFIFIHLLKEISDRKIGGPRWIAWVTGFLALGFFWFEGWTGYLLVWDTRAQQIAIGTSKMLDLVPIFADPLSRTFLTDQHINTLLFFLIFFFHMLIPLAIVLGLWLHINRLNRTNWITNKTFSIIILISLVIISLLKPAYSSEPAKMQIMPQKFTMDYWFLLPIWFTDRLSGASLWFITFLATIIVFSFPWIFYKSRFKPSIVDEERCQNCQQCFIDCPYNAISMIPRENREPTARVNPKLCVSCGICNGSCLPISVGIPYYNVLEKRRQYQKWKQLAKSENKPFYLAFICANSILNNLKFDPETGKTDHPLFKDFYITSAPCVGWIHTRTLELLFKNEPEGGSLIIGCPECTYREGTKWLEERIFKDRDPVLRKEKVEPNKIKIIYPLTIREVKNQVELLKKELKDNQISHFIYNQTNTKKLTVALLIFTFIISLIIILFSDLSYKTPFNSQPSLIVSFKHPGQISEECKELSQEELNKLPVHMRKPKICERKRSPVRMVIFINNEKILEKSYRPGGIWEDLNSIAIEKISLSPGNHNIKILIGDTHNKEEWNYQYEENIEFKEWENRVILFDKIHNFQIY